jgi:alkanesulfonate monooxygenase SsuD/methylene tetrahydromethanopterin reductase-like flavin-dependent oxidoreductase (luciferase family)
MLRLGVCILPDMPWSESAPLWRRVEDLGFDSAWTYDHLVWGGLPDGPWYAAMPTLTAAAAATSRIKLGTLVSSANFRHPVPFAQEIMTLDDISGGRFVLGYGAGSVNADATQLGQGIGTPEGTGWTNPERSARFRESVEIMDLLLSGAPQGRPRNSYQGTYYSAVDARMEPGCVQRPRVPFGLAAGGPKGMRVVAKHASSWIVTDDPRDEEATAEDAYRNLAAQLVNLDKACEAEGRDPATLDRLLLTGFSALRPMASIGEFQDVAGRVAEMGFTDLVVHHPRRGEPFLAAPDILEEIAAVGL